MSFEKLQGVTKVTNEYPEGADMAGKGNYRLVGTLAYWKDGKATPAPCKNCRTGAEHHRNRWCETGGTQFELPPDAPIERLIWYADIRGRKNPPACCYECGHPPNHHAMRGKCLFDATYYAAPMSYREALGRRARVAA